MQKEFIITKKEVTVQSAVIDGRRCVLRAFNDNGQAAVYKALSEIKSDNLAEIVKIEQTENGFCVCEEYIDGMTLGELLTEKGNFPEKEILHVAKQLCAVIDKIHRAKIIHRDIKPDNVMLTADGRVVLLDFDAARLFSDIEKSKDTRLLGTEGYAALEQYGFSQTDFRTDVYGLGATLYELHTGSVPHGNTVYKGKLKKPIEKSVSFNPDDRYKDGKSLYKSLIFSYYKAGFVRCAISAAVTLLIFAAPFILQKPIHTESGQYLPYDYSRNMTERTFAGEPIDVWAVLPEKLDLTGYSLDADGFARLLGNESLNTALEDTLGKEKDDVLGHYVNGAYYFSYDTENEIYFAQGANYAWEITSGGTVHFAYIRYNEGPENSKVWEYTNEPRQQCGEEMKNWMISAKNSASDVKAIFDEMQNIAKE